MNHIPFTAEVQFHRDGITNTQDISIVGQTTIYIDFQLRFSVNLWC
jgi:hypothetical protein